MHLDDNRYGGIFKNETEIEHIVLEYFRIKDMPKFQDIQGRFEDLLTSIKEKIDVDFLFVSDHNLEPTYKRIDQIYQKRLTDHIIDERHFLKERVNNVFVANRFTPFGVRRAIGKNKNPQHI